VEFYKGETKEEDEKYIQKKIKCAFVTINKAAIDKMIR
jgi:hypothetical protein